MRRDIPRAVTLFDSMKIRRYRASDQSGVIGLFRQFMAELTPPRLGEAFQAYVEQAIAEELGQIDEYYLRRQDQGFWVAEAGGVVGMVGIEHRDDRTAELRRMAVDKAQRRKGIARKLLAAAEAFSRGRGYQRIVLSTSELQTAAMRLYESSGYRLVREEKNAPSSHKSAGAGLTRYHYEKALC
jgi:ribosomal protein S18 acetylase RimI-like enzyme